MESIFETAHLRVRQFTPDDARPLYEIHLDAKVKKWFPNESYADIAEAVGAVRFYADCTASHRLPYVLAVELKETGELIGDAGISAVEGRPGEAEVGYVIREKYRGRGYATELVQAMTDFTSSVLGIHVLYGRVVHGNHPSARVLEKNGYCFAAEEFGAEDDPYGNGMLVYRKEC